MLINKDLSVHDIYTTKQNALLRGIRPIFRYDKSNTRTDELLGFAYSVIDEESLEPFIIKVAEDKPLVEEAELVELQKQGHVRVKMVNLTVRIYAGRNGVAESFKADAIEFASDTKPKTKEVK